METFDKLLEAHRKPQRVFIFNISYEVISLCYPHRHRLEKFNFEKMREK